ncbi:hypothetical protein EVC45_38505 [Paraburkholderia sp. UYCP14C]|uniref:hypothetical protein n=1 Tax=Paraburkholderia sp. UYCP14C TaxID=2511130 RepID=UPI00101EF557|nr:hypothetical protein [Paraburkholderia sp. UYCP14C]RZF24505.1 hypothetical protein EVC45_38505 [Paraburkholderia sp. UYCP14C]
MESSISQVKPIALVRPPGAHRIEAFSPKLRRRITFYRRFLLELWMLLETDPAVVTFCERPGYIQIEGNSRLADFLIRYVDHDELVILTVEDLDGSMGETTGCHRSFDRDALSIRRVGPADLAAARVWIENWQRMLPYLVTNRGLVPPTLSEAIVRFLAAPQRLLAIEREFSAGDPVLPRAALFDLLYSGQVVAPELHSQPLSLLTSFVKAEARA